MKKFVSLLLLLIFVSLTINENIVVAVRPWVTFYDGRNRLSNGIGNYGKNTQYYYVDPNISSAGSTIDGAMSKWVNSNGTGVYTPISYRRTGSKPSSLLDFQRAATDRPNVYAWVTHWNGGTQVVPIGSRHWAWAKVEITSLYLRSNGTTQMRTIAHEIGHAFGLDHNPDSVTKLMYPSNSSAMPTGPVASELQGINFLYK